VLIIISFFLSSHQITKTEAIKLFCVICPGSFARRIF